MGLLLLFRPFRVGVDDVKGIVSLGISGEARGDLWIVRKGDDGVLVGLPRASQHNPSLGAGVGGRPFRRLAEADVVGFAKRVVQRPVIRGVSRAGDVGRFMVQSFFGVETEKK